MFKPGNLVNPDRQIEEETSQSHPSDPYITWLLLLATYLGLATLTFHMLSVVHLMPVSVLRGGIR